MVTVAVQGVTVTLGRRTVIAGVTTVFAPGQLTGIIGPNGAGKSTLARAMLGLVPHGGLVKIDSVDAGTLPPAQRARTIAYLPQGQTLHWPLSVERLVSLGRLPHLAPLSRIAEADIAAIDRAMARADVLALRHRDATELSGGERARVMLARALAVEAPALIADEPLASLDPGHQIDVMELLLAEARAGATVVAVLHDLTMAARYCDQLLLVNGGAIAAEGQAEEVLTPANLARVYGIDAKLDTSGATPAVVTRGRIRG